MSPIVLFALALACAVGAVWLVVADSRRSQRATAARVTGATPPAGGVPVIPRDKIAAAVDSFSPSFFDRLRPGALRRRRQHVAKELGLAFVATDSGVGPLRGVKASAVVTGPLGGRQVVIGTVGKDTVVAVTMPTATPVTAAFLPKVSQHDEAATQPPSDQLIPAHAVPKGLAQADHLEPVDNTLLSGWKALSTDVPAARRLIHAHIIHLLDHCAKAQAVWISGSWVMALIQHEAELSGEGLAGLFWGLGRVADAGLVLPPAQDKPLGVVCVYTRSNQPGVLPAGDGELAVVTDGDADDDQPEPATPRPDGLGAPGGLPRPAQAVDLPSRGVAVTHGAMTLDMVGTDEVDAIGDGTPPPPMVGVARVPRRLDGGFTLFRDTPPNTDEEEDPTGQKEPTNVEQDHQQLHDAHAGDDDRPTPPITLVPLDADEEAGPATDSGKS